MPRKPAADRQRLLNLLTSILSEKPDFTVAGEPASWRSIKETAVPEGVAPLIAYLMRSHVPAVERAWCDGILKASWAHYSQCIAQLEYVTAVLNAEGITPLALKGPLLAQRHYHPPFLRKPSADLDLAVPGASVERACAALGKVGYSLPMPIREALARTHHVTLDHPTGMRVELHVRLSHGVFGIPMGDFFQRAIPWPLPLGGKVLILAPADELLHLVLHRSYGLATLFHLYEVRLLWRSASAVVREEMLALASQYRVAGIIRLTDAAFRSRWGEAFLPNNVALPRTWLQNRITNDFYQKFERYSDPLHKVTVVTRLHRRWIDFQLTDRPVDAVRWASLMMKAFVVTTWSRLRDATSIY